MSLARIIVPLLAAAAGIGGGYAFMNAVGPDVSSGGGTTTDSHGVTVSNDFSGPPPELKGGDKNSMLRPEEFGKALAIIEKEGGGPGARLQYLRLAPGRVNVAINGDGKVITLYLIPGGKVYSRSESDSSSSLGDNLAVGKITAGSPWKIVRRMGVKSGITPDDIDYLVTSSAIKPQWLIYPKGGATHWTAALNGAHPTRCC